MTSRSARLPNWLAIVLGVWLGASFADAQTARTHITTGSSLPSACDPGDLYFKTGSSAGLYACDPTVADQWNLISPVPTFTPTGGDQIIYYRDSDDSFQPVTIGGGCSFTSGTLACAPEGPNR